jgi:hypothetical protein
LIDISNPRQVNPGDQTLKAGAALPVEVQDQPTYDSAQMDLYNELPAPTAPVEQNVYEDTEDDKMEDKPVKV